MVILTDADFDKLTNVLSRGGDPNSRLRMIRIERLLRTILKQQGEIMQLSEREIAILGKIDRASTKLAASDAFVSAYLILIPEPKEKLPVTVSFSIDGGTWRTLDDIRTGMANIHCEDLSK